MFSRRMVFPFMAQLGLAASLPAIQTEKTTPAIAPKEPCLAKKLPTTVTVSLSHGVLYRVSAGGDFKGRNIRAVVNGKVASLGDPVRVGDRLCIYAEGYGGVNDVEVYNPQNQSMTAIFRV